MNRAIIISGGDYSSPDIHFTNAYIIACDKGYSYAQRMNIIPHVIIGDFDSLDEPETGNIPVIKLPVEKDDTDTMYAIKHAFEKGYTDITVLCALGGQLDHQIANLQSMAYVATHGGTCRILSEKNNAFTFTGGSVSVPKTEHANLSLFSLSDVCENLSISGSYYDVKDITLTNSFPLGHGNHWIKDKITITMERGILLVVISKLE